jgi:hypothetical protein
MRSISIFDDILVVLQQLAVAIPEVYINYDVTCVELQYDHEDRPNVFDIVFVESEDTEVVIGEIVLSEDFYASFEIFQED